MMDPLRTRVARADWGDNQFCGWSVGGELAGRESFMGALALATGGPRLSPEDAVLLDDVAVCFTAADPRIWPLKVARLASAFGSSRLGYACAHMALEGGMIGPCPAPDAAELFVSFRNGLEGASLWTLDAMVQEHLDAGGRFLGFGVPYRPIDERVVALEACLHKRGRSAGPYWRLMRDIEAALGKRKKLPVNIVGAAAALELDLGFTPAQIGVLMTAAASLSFYANAVEGAAQKPAVLQSMPLEHVEYVGREARTSPRGRKLVDSQSPMLSAAVYR